MVDLRNLWSDDDLPPNLAWEKPPGEADGRRRPAPAPSTEAGRRGDGTSIPTSTGPARRWAPSRWSRTRCSLRRWRTMRPPTSTTCRRRPTRSPSRTSRPRRAGAVISENFGAPAVDDGRAARGRGAQHASWRRGFTRSRTSARRCARRSRRRASGSRSRPPSPRSASSSACARSSTRKRRTSSICATRSTPRSGRSSTTRTRSASSIGRGAISRRARSGSSGAWSPPTRRSPSWARTARSRPSARRD